MLTEHELKALVLVLQRAGLNPVEVVAVDAILQKLAVASIQQPQPASNEEKGNDK